MVCVTELKERLRTDLTVAMRERDQVRLRTLRMALTSITNEEVSGAASRELSDDEVLRVLTREAKKRREAAEAFESAGRADQAAAERAEGDVLARYLPAQLGDDELAGIVEAAITETGATEMRAMGQVMKVVTPRIAGRADGARVAAEVRRRLAAGPALSGRAATDRKIASRPRHHHVWGPLPPLSRGVTVPRHATG
jgi:hypothetical protein